jgi:hypothetical protein
MMMMMIIIIIVIGLAYGQGLSIQSLQHFSSYTKLIVHGGGGTNFFIKADCRQTQSRVHMI